MKPRTSTYNFTETVKGKDGNDCVLSAEVFIKYDTKGAEINNAHNHELVSLHVWVDFIKAVEKFAESELAKWEAPTQATAPEPAPLFTSHDGKLIFEGDEVYFVGKNTLKSGKANLSKLKIEAGHHLHYIYFSSQEKADEYILRHKPCLSLDDLLGVWGDNENHEQDHFFAESVLFQNFENAVRIKLGMMDKPEPPFAHAEDETYSMKTEKPLERLMYDNTGTIMPPHNAMLIAEKFCRDNSLPLNELPKILARLLNDICLIVSKECHKDLYPNFYVAKPKNLSDIRDFTTDSGKSLIDKPELTLQERIHKSFNDILFRKADQPEHPPVQSESSSPLHFNKDATIKNSAHEFVRTPLATILAEMKFGRPAEEQMHLQSLIDKINSDQPHPHAQPEWEVKGLEHDKELAKREDEMREKQRAFLKLVLKSYVPKEAAETIADKYFMFVR